MVTPEEEFETRVERLIALARGPNANKVAGDFLHACEEKAYVRGQCGLIDILRRELDKHDLRQSDQ